MADPMLEREYARLKSIGSTMVLYDNGVIWELL